MQINFVSYIDLRQHHERAHGGGRIMGLKPIPPLSTWKFFESYQGYEKHAHFNGTGKIVLKPSY